MDSIDQARSNLKIVGKPFADAIGNHNIDKYRFSQQDHDENYLSFPSRGGTALSRSESSDDDRQHVAIASHPLFAEIGNLMKSYHHSPRHNNSKATEVTGPSVEPAWKGGSSKNSTLENAIGSRVLQPGASARDEEMDDFVGLNYVSSVSTESELYPSSTYTAGVDEANTRMTSSHSSSFSDESSQPIAYRCKTTQIDSLHTTKSSDFKSTSVSFHMSSPNNGQGTYGAKFDKLVLHVSSRDSEVVRATTALYMSPRDHQSPAAIFVSPRNHLSASNIEEHTTLASAANIFTFNDDDSETRENCPPATSTYSQGLEDDAQYKEDFAPIKHLLSRVINGDYRNTQTTLSEVAEESSDAQASSVIFRGLPSFDSDIRASSDIYKTPQSAVQVHEFQKDVNDFTRRLREIKENIRCDVYLVEDKQKSTEVNKTTSHRIDEIQEEVKSTPLSLSSHQALDSVSDTTKDVLYVFSVTEQDQREQRSVDNSNGCSERLSNVPEEDFLQSQCAKHVNPGLLDHIKKYGNFELYKILPPPPPPPCTPPAIKRTKKTITSAHNEANSIACHPNNNITGVKADVDSVIALDSFSTSESNSNDHMHTEPFSADKDEGKSFLDLEFLEADSMCDMLRTKLENLTTRDGTNDCTSSNNDFPETFIENDSAYKHSKTDAKIDNEICRRRNEKILKLKKGRSIRKGDNACQQPEENSNQKVEECEQLPKNLTDEEEENATVESSKFTLPASRRERILALKKKNVVRKDASQIHGSDTISQISKETEESQKSETLANTNNAPLLSRKDARVLLLKKKKMAARSGAVCQASDASLSLNVNEEAADKVNPVQQETKEGVSATEDSSLSRRDARVLAIKKKKQARKIV